MDNLNKILSKEEKQKLKEAQKELKKQEKEKKKAEISHARQFAMYIMREVTNLTYEEIGVQFGGKKHSTVIYSLEAAESKMEDNPQLKSTVYDIMKSIKDERND